MKNMYGIIFYEMYDIQALHTCVYTDIYVNAYSDSENIKNWQRNEEKKRQRQTYKNIRLAIQMEFATSEGV